MSTDPASPGPAPAGPDAGEPAPIALGTAFVPTATSTVLRTTCATHPCLVCWIRDRIERSGDAADWTLAGEPLHVNILGFRQESSVTDAFDDAMAVLCRVLPADQRGEYEEVVEAEIRERLSELDHGRARLVACTAPETKGLWLAAVYQYVTTDPGLEARRDDVYSRKVASARRSRDANEKAISDLTVRIENQRGKLAEETNARAKRRLAAGVRRLEKAKARREGRREQLDRRVEKAEERQQDYQERRDRRGSGKEMQTRDGSKPGWLAQGRALVNPGVHAGEYRYRLHKGLKGHVALGVGYIYHGNRFYSAGGVRKRFASWVRDDAKREEWAKKRGKEPRPHFKWQDGAVSVAEWTPFGGSEQEFAEGDARVLVRERIETDARGRPRKRLETVLLVKGLVGEEEHVLDDRDVLVVRARVGGTNIHRAHNTKLVDGRVVGRLGRGPLDDDRVRNWSEGCQTYRSPDEFAEFLRLCAVSHRWRCTRADGARAGDAGCAFVAPSPAGATELSDGERALEEAYGAWEVSRVLAARYRKQAAKRLPEVQRLQKSRADQESLLRLLPPDEAPEAREQARAQLREIDERLARATERYAEPRAIADELEGEASAQEELAGLEASEGDPRSIAWARKKAESARQWHARVTRPGSRAKPTVRAKAAKNLARRESLVAGRERRAAVLRRRAGLREEVEALRRDFLRERAAFYGADHLRVCQVKWDGCPVRFDYVLVELPAEDREYLVSEALADRRYRAWDGDLALGGAGPSPAAR